MIENSSNEAIDLQVRELAVAHRAWSAATRECDRALHAWFESSGADDALRYAAYRAALDREQAAARELERLATGAQRRRAAARERVHTHRFAEPRVRELPHG
jgi:hypothetical protein